MQFSLEQRNLVIRALDEAENHTSRYYCIPPFRWQELPYDLLTRQDTEWETLPEAVLAQIQCIEKTSLRRRRPYDFYRIQLNDPSILMAAERENLSSCFYQFLVYILTHEMIHLVRLSTMLRPEAARPADSDSSEEHRVHAISRQILSAAGTEAFKPILERFCFPASFAHLV